MNNSNIKVPQFLIGPNLSLALKDAMIASTSAIISNNRTAITASRDIQGLASEIILRVLAVVRVDMVVWQLIPETVPMTVPAVVSAAGPPSMASSILRLPVANTEYVRPARPAPAVAAAGSAIIDEDVELPKGQTEEYPDVEGDPEVVKPRVVKRPAKGRARPRRAARR